MPQSRWIFLPYISPFPRNAGYGKYSTSARIDFAELCMFGTSLDIPTTRPRPHEQIKDYARNTKPYQNNRTGGNAAKEKSACALQQNQGSPKANGVPQVPKAQPLGFWRQSQRQDGVRSGGNGVARPRHTSLPRKSQQRQLLGGIAVATGAARRRSAKNTVLPRQELDS